MLDAPHPATAPASATALCDHEDLLKRLRLPSKWGLSISSVHEANPPELTLPASLGRAVLKRQREYLAGRRCAHDAMLRAGHPAPFYPAMGEDRLPIWSEDWLGSISHSGDHAIAVAAPRRDCSVLGIDIQQQASEKTMNAIQSLIAKPEELIPLEDLDGHTKLLLIFSAKESLYKALYPQVRKIQEFDAVKLIQADAQVLRFELTQDWSTQWKAGACIEVNYTIVRDYIVTATYIVNEYAVDSRTPPEAGH